MKNILNIRSFFVLVFSVCFLSTAYAQKVKKNKVRLKVQYVKVMNEGVYFDIKAGAKVKKQNIAVSNIDLIVYILCLYKIAEYINSFVFSVRYGSTITLCRGFIINSLRLIV